MQSLVLCALNCRVKKSGVSGLSPCELPHSVVSALPGCLARCRHIRHQVNSPAELERDKSSTLSRETSFCGFANITLRKQRGGGGGGREEEMPEDTADGSLRPWLLPPGAERRLNCCHPHHIHTHTHTHGYLYTLIRTQGGQRF